MTAAGVSEDAEQQGVCWPLLFMLGVLMERFMPLVLGLFICLIPRLEVGPMAGRAHPVRLARTSLISKATEALCASLPFFDRHPRAPSPLLIFISLSTAKIYYEAIFIAKLTLERRPNSFVHIISHLIKWVYNRPFSWWARRTDLDWTNHNLENGLSLHSFL